MSLLNSFVVLLYLLCVQVGLFDRDLLHCSGIPSLWIVLVARDILSFENDFLSLVGASSVTTGMACVPFAYA